MRIAAAIGPIVSKLAGRAAKKNDPERAAFRRGRAPGEDHPTRAEEPEVERARARRHRAVLRAQGRGQRARHRGRSEDRRTRARAGHRGQGHSRACTPPATQAARPRRGSTEAPEGRSRSGWSSATWRDGKQPGGRMTPEHHRRVTSTVETTVEVTPHGQRPSSRVNIFDTHLKALGPGSQRCGPWAACPAASVKRSRRCCARGRSSASGLLGVLAGVRFPGRRTRMGLVRRR